MLQRLIGDVFGHAYVAAMRPTIAVSVGLLLAGAALCLLLRRPAAPPVSTQTAPATRTETLAVVPVIPEAAGQPAGGHLGDGYPADQQTGRESAL
ncbi:MAG: hypothetical protein JO242_24020 [Streptosporangiaceae bacterium]|nr:hypothetical protein [Streptosporangiaceae bacterium]